MRIKNLVLGIGIFVVYALVLWQGIQTFYSAPEFDDFCEGARERFPPLERIGDCEIPQGLEVKIDACQREEGYFKYDYGEDGCIVGGVCDACNLDYEEARDLYSRNIFIVALIIGVVTFIVGFRVLRIEPVGSALIAGGIWAVFYGTVWNWRNFGAGIRFVLLLVVLILLIYVALRFNKKKGLKRFFRKRL